MTPTDYAGWAAVGIAVSGGCLLWWAIEEGKRHYHNLARAWSDGDTGQCPRCGRRERLVAGMDGDRFAIWTQDCGEIIAVETTQERVRR